MKITNARFYINGYLRYRRFQEPPVVIGGCERSGTTLLQSIISAHPEIHAIEDETWAFCYGPKAGFDSNNPIRTERLFKALGRKPIPCNYSRWCEKTPANIFYFNSVINYFSGRVKLIYMVRDGRDVITSMHPENYAKPWVTLERWLDAAEEGYRYRDEPLVLTVRYEDLIADFDHTIHRICGHIGVDTDKNILDWHDHATIRSSKNLIGRKVSNLSKTSIKKYDSPGFRQMGLIEKLMANEKATNLLSAYSYL